MAGQSVQSEAMTEVSVMQNWVQPSAPARISFATIALAPIRWIGLINSAPMLAF
jgi:hypothetical protein